MEQADRMADMEAGVTYPELLVTILIPVFNDWEAASMLLGRLDPILGESGLRVDILFVDDGSTARRVGAFAPAPFRAIRLVEVLELRRNLGHQRAIAIGLAFLEGQKNTPAVVVMDGDGEDDPNDVPRLLARYREEAGERIVFAERTKRSESLTFRVFYALYRVVHQMLTGYGVRIGNFSVIPRRRLTSLVSVSELWNHYAAAAIKSRQAHCTIPTRRATRLQGRSTMNFVSLVTHGLSAISVFSELIGVRLLVLSLFAIAATVSASAVILYIRFATDLAIPGWATVAVGVCLLLFTQSVLLALAFCFMILSSRNHSPFLPLRDYPNYINRIYKLG